MESNPELAAAYEAQFVRQSSRTVFCPRRPVRVNQTEPMLTEISPNVDKPKAAAASVPAASLQKAVARIKAKYSLAAQQPLKMPILIESATISKCKGKRSAKSEEYIPAKVISKESRNCKKKPNEINKPLMKKSRKMCQSMLAQFQ